MLSEYNLVRLPSSAISNRLPRSLAWHDPFVPQARTSTVECFLCLNIHIITQLILKLITSSNCSYNTNRAYICMFDLIDH